jgi:hypothetical protein
MSNDSRSPLSGDVTQAINPMSWWNWGTQQAGFININAARTDNPELERRIVEDVASYGRQLGRIIDALDVLVAHAPVEGMTAPERDALRDFSALAGAIAKVKDRERPALTRANVDRVIEEVQALERHDADLYRDLVARIRAAFPERLDRAPQGHDPTA